MPTNQDTLRAARKQPAQAIWIYFLLDPITKDVRYIGKTNQPQVRFRNHCNEKSNCHRSHWIQSLIRRGLKPIMQLVHKVPPDQSWQDAERALIRHAIWAPWPITNGTLGGDGVESTPEVREKISLSQKGRKLSEGRRAKLIKTLRIVKKGDKLPPEWRESISRGKLGKKFTKSHCLRISESKRRVSPGMVKEITSRLSQGESQGSVARALRISQPTVHAIKHGLRKYSQR